MCCVSFREGIYFHRGNPASHIVHTAEILHDHATFDSVGLFVIYGFPNAKKCVWQLWRMLDDNFPKTLPKIKMDPRSMEGSSCPKEIPNLAKPSIFSLSDSSASSPPPEFCGGLPGWEHYLRVKTVEVWGFFATQMRRTEELMNW